MAIGADVMDVEVDIRQPETVTAMFDAAEERFGLPDVLVNNAAGNFPVPAEDMSPNAWRVVVDIVLNGTFACSRRSSAGATSPPGRPARSSTWAPRAWTGVRAAPRLPKAGQSMTESLAVEWGPYGIRVNGLVPGCSPTPTRPPTSGRRPAGARRGQAPAGLAGGQPHELGWAATYLASPYAAFVNGHRDGGRRRQLAAPVDAEPRGGADPGADGQGTLHPRLVSGGSTTSAVTSPNLLLRRLDTDPDGPYLDVVGTPLTAADVARDGGALAAALCFLGVEPGDRHARSSRTHRGRSLVVGDGDGQGHPVPINTMSGAPT